ncbi:MAG TPA: ABC transporter permease [Polyangiaceae bacterium]|jgi:phospholipid/cholesterol/gamma-HCH transport system permease protein|nr:ABC transporter permease [Polyangiaceae bacterium]
MMDSQPALKPPSAPTAEAEQSLVSSLVQPVVTALEGVGGIVGLTGRTVAWMLRPPYRVGLFFNAMEFIGVQSVFIVGLTGAFSGMVLALQMVTTLRQFSAEGVVGSVVAISMTREISPVFASLMVTARAGSAMAAELGNMRVTEQIDAVTTMGVSPVQYLLSPRLIASVLMVPLLCILYTCVGLVGAWFVAIEGMAVDPGVFLSNIEQRMVPMDFWMGEIKAACFGFLIAAISCYHGFNAKGGARGVGIATTRAVVHSAVVILIVNYLLTTVLL